MGGVVSAENKLKQVMPFRKIIGLLMTDVHSIEEAHFSILLDVMSKSRCRIHFANQLRQLATIVSFLGYSTDPDPSFD